MHRKNNFIALHSYLWNSLWTFTYNPSSNIKWWDFWCDSYRLSYVCKSRKRLHDTSNIYKIIFRQIYIIFDKLLIIKNGFKAHDHSTTTLLNEIKNYKIKTKYILAQKNKASDLSLKLKSNDFIDKIFL